MQKNSVWHSHGRVWKNESRYFLTEEVTSSFDQRVPLPHWKPVQVQPWSSRGRSIGKLSCPRTSLWIKTPYLTYLLVHVLIGRTHSRPLGRQVWWYFFRKPKSVGLVNSRVLAAWLGHQGDGVVEEVPIDRIYWLLIFESVKSKGHFEEVNKWAASEVNN